MRRLSGLRGVALFFGLMAVLGFVLPDYEILGLNQHLLLAVNVLALNFCLGLGGQASLAQGAFCGLGAYGSVILHQWMPGASLLVLPLVAAGTFALAFLVSHPLERLGEGFLAMATLGLSLIFTNLAVSMMSLTGGPDGMIVTSKLAAGGLLLTGDAANYAAFLLLLALGMAVFSRLRDSRVGRALLACKSDPVAASACGIRRPFVRSLSFGTGAAFSALAGALYAHYAGFVSPSEFDLELSLKTLLYLVIGGPGHLLRPVLAVLGLETVLGHVQFLGDAKVLFHGLLLTAALVLPRILPRILPRLSAAGKGGR